jgi:hypothetical protein
MISKNILCILPPPPFTDNNFGRFLYYFKKRFGKNQILLTCRNVEKDVDYYVKELSQNIKPVFIDKNGKILIKNKTIIPEAVIVITNNKGQIFMNENKLNKFKIPCFKYNFLHSDFIPVNGNSASRYDTNIFSKIASRSLIKNEYIFYPYGYYVLSPNFGEINEFGFRVKSDYLELKERDNKQILICITGGSAAWGAGVYYDETFANLLEKKLNKTYRKYKFKVLNFGMLGYLLFNEIITYIVFILELNPDITISFTGFNNFHMGLFSNSYLIEQYKLNYNVWLENWAKILRGKKDHDKPDFFNPLGNFQPKGIIKEIIFRLNQYKNMVESREKKFISILQPFWGSKKFHTKYEKECYYNTYSFAPNYKLISSLSFLYNRVEKMNIFDINAHYEVQKFQSKKLFFDLMHLTPIGHKIISEFIFNYIGEKKLWV